MRANRLICAAPASHTLAGFPVHVARVPAAPLSMFQKDRRHDSQRNRAKQFLRQRRPAPRRGRSLLLRTEYFRIEIENRRDDEKLDWKQQLQAHRSQAKRGGGAHIKHLIVNKPACLPLRAVTKSKAIARSL